jgi:hypothetical protein
LRRPFNNPPDDDALNRAPAWLDLARTANQTPTPRDARSAARNGAVLPPRGGDLFTPERAQEGAGTWQRLLDPILPRPFVITSWRLLHGQLGCRAFLHHVQRKIPHISTPCSPFCCPPACTGQSRFETLSHAFLDCPDTAPAMDWLCGAWAALTGKARPPLTAAVLLADDLTAWKVDSPANQPLLLPLWTRLRVAVLVGIWKARCAREKGSASAREQGTLRYISVFLGITLREEVGAKNR